jgi:dTDP-4-dehydrorhamnose reductase
MSKNVLICGATGLLGNPLRARFEGAGFRVVGAGFTKGAELMGDLRDPELASRLLDEASPDYVVNLVAATNVDQCERDPHAAYLANAKVVENIAEWVRGHGQAHLVQISTDQVYNGHDRQLNREHQVFLGNYYAYSKYLGERAALAAGATVLRTNFFGKSEVSGRVSFTDWLSQALRKGEGITLITDVFFSPLTINTVCDLIVRIAPQRRPGVFNMGSHGGMSKAEFGLAFAELLGLNADKISLSTSENFFQAYRPKNMLMDSGLFMESFGLSLPGLADELRSIKEEYAC